MLVPERIRISLVTFSENISSQHWRKAVHITKMKDQLELERVGVRRIAGCQHPGRRAAEVLTSADL